MKSILLTIVILILWVNTIFAKNITDILGRDINIPDKIDKIVAIGPGAVRFVIYLGESNKLCGIENIENKVEDKLFRPYTFVIKDKIKNLEIVGEGGPGKMPYFEKLTILNPDLIVGTLFSKSQADLISEKTGVPVLILDYGETGLFNEIFFKSLKILSIALNNEKVYLELEEFIQSINDDLQKRTLNIKYPKRIYIGGVAYKGIQDINSTIRDFYPLRLINIDNVAKNIKSNGHAVLNWESLYQFNPDYIFIDKYSLNMIKRNFEKNRDKFNLLKAFQERRVYTILPYNSYNTNVELGFIDAYIIGKTVYPDRFKDIELRSKIEEILKKFLKVDIVLEDIDINFNFF